MSNPDSAYINFPMERVARIELATQPWQGRVITVILYPHCWCPRGDSNSQNYDPKSYTYANSVTGALLVSDARIELAPHAPKARMIPFHQSELFH